MASIFTSPRVACDAQTLPAGVSFRLRLLLLLVCRRCSPVNSYTCGYGHSFVLPSHAPNAAIKRQIRGKLVSSSGRGLFGASSDMSEGAAQSNNADSTERDTIGCATRAEDEPFLDEFGHPIEEKRIDYVGAGTLGDIMSSDEGFRFSAADDQLEQPASTALPESGDIDASPDFDEVTAYAIAVTANIREEDGALSHDEGLVTTAGGTLQARFGQKIPEMSPLERIALTSNGNLQRIFSSYYDAPVHVHVDRCEMRNADDGDVDNGGSGTVPGCDLLGNFEVGSRKHNGESIAADDPSEPASGGNAVWDREVHLSVHSQRFCTARSVVTVRSEDCIRLVHSGKVGIGQLFRYLDRLPTFEILDAGRRLDDGGMWRTYTLECRELSCVIREDFVSNAWNIAPTSGNSNE